jgi:hypothetical protein
MSIVRRCAVVLLLLLGSIGLPAPAQASAVSIAQARALPLGTVVTVHGTATAPSGWLESSLFDKGFALQDFTAGIYVSVAEDPRIDPRDRVRVTGELRESFGLRQLVATEITVNGRALLPVLPRLVATGAVSESTEGSIVRVIGKVTQAPVSDLPYGYIFHVDDGSGDLTIFVSTPPGIDLSGLATGDLVIVTGFSGQFDNHYEINPRFQTDILG